MKLEEVIVCESIEYRGLLSQRIKNKLTEDVCYENMKLNKTLKDSIVLGNSKLIDSLIDYKEDYEIYIDKMLEKYEEDIYENLLKKKFPIKKFEKESFNQSNILDEILSQINNCIHSFFSKITYSNKLTDKTAKYKLFILFIFHEIIKKEIYVKFLYTIVENHFKSYSHINSIDLLVEKCFMESNMKTSQIYKFICFYDKTFDYENLIRKDINSLSKKDQEYVFSKKITKNNAQALIITEGKTDWKHLKKALLRFKKQGIYTDLNIQFEEYEDEISMSDSELVSIVISYSKTLQLKKHIMIFDRDTTQKKDIKKIFKKENSYNSHGNNVYSVFIPEIDNTLNQICIEFYYQQEEIKKAWYQGKRLFYGNEFNKDTQISICGKYKTDKPYPELLDILDGDNQKKVYHINDEQKQENNIALSKNKFAEYIDTKDEFKDFDIENFKLIFDVIEKIVND